MLIENVVAILKGANHFSIQCTVFPAVAKMLIFSHFEKVQYRCTTTITQVHNSPKIALENLLSVRLLVRTNLH